ncbi:DeoR/GlpR family DNA-binding transcription regulator, partial [Brevundimonas sp. ZS04]|uniref:DeoR/GlpR family DNA-binding transcription regulator n=1 Tax=Brevundimonas sp. ZS04 TaxID=1906854 RepID=UPI00097A0D06
MYAPERHQTILEQARAHGRVDVRELAELLEVTPETIRRDLTSLERRGLVRRAHGGAIPVERAALASPVTDREGVRTSEKLEIATLALDELPDSGSIIIDAGTTAIRLAELLPSDRE